MLKFSTLFSSFLKNSILPPVLRIPNLITTPINYFSKVKAGLPHYFKLKLRKGCLRYKDKNKMSSWKKRGYIRPMNYRLANNNAVLKRIRIVQLFWLNLGRPSLG